MLILLQGMLIGIVFGVPAGVIGALTLERSFEYGFKAGFVTGLGSTFVDILYAFVGVLGITVIQELLQKWQMQISIIGGIVICLMGISVFRKRKERTMELQKVTIGKYPVMFLSSFMIAACNPATIFSFLAVFATMGIESGMTAINGTKLVLGIGIGTCIWWAVISAAACKVKKKMTEGIYQKLHRIMGILLFIFGIAVILNGII